MTHLPECWLSEGKFDALCLCDRLRACEQRVEEAMDRAWTQTVALAVAHTRTATLDAAREAIESLPVAISSYYPDDSLRDVGFWRSSALAAIDALRQKP